MSETHNVEAINQSNDGYTTAGVIQLRLDTAPMLDSIEAFLRGQRIAGYEKNKAGMVVPVYAAFGYPKMNEAGVQSLMAWLTPMFSPATVQGNFPTFDELNDYISEVEIDLSEYLWMNRVEWDLKKREVKGIIDGIVKVAIAYFSRLVGNKERESYGASMVHKESSHVDSKKGIFGF